MPISICTTKEQVEKWAKELIREGKYIIYLTAEDEVILEPLRSTRPLKYCYYKGASSEDAKNLASSISKTYNLSIIEVDRISWDIEKGPYIRMPIE